MFRAFPRHKPLLALGAALVMSAMPAVALGHVSLVSSSPEAGDNLDTAPTEVTLSFDGELDPAASGFTVRDDDGNEVGSGEVDLDVADRNVLAGSVDAAEPGVYTVEWAVVGADGHAITGTFAFGYATDEEIPGTTGEHGHEPPDTSVRATGAGPLAVAGVALLALAGLVAARRPGLR